MAVKTEYISLKTKGFTDIIDITGEITRAVAQSGLANGIVTVFVPGSTGGITTIEYEPGLLKDLPEMLEKIAPVNARYHHDDTWHDGNGYAHLRSTIIGTSLVVPVINGQLQLGTWQQIILLDFDNKPRTRRVILQFTGI